MVETFGLLPRHKFNTISELETVIKYSNEIQKKWIWLDCDDFLIEKEINSINKALENSTIKLMIASENLLSKGLRAQALIIEDFQKIKVIKQKYPLILIGGKAHDIALCKNIELFQGDFVCMGPFEEIGELPYVTLIPETPDYEWRFIDITIPVIGFGEISTEQLSKLSQKVDFSGFACSIGEYKKHIKVPLRFPQQ